MKIVILGAGNVGIRIARQLIHEGRDVVLIDRDEETVKDAINSLDCMVILGEANRRETLIQAGAQNADIFISVTESDELNIIACGLVSAEFQVKTTIARVRNEEYTEAIAHGRSFMGITHVINPDIEAANAILRIVEHGVISDILSFPNNSFEMRSIQVLDSSPAIGATLLSLKQSSGRNFLVAVILRDGQPIVPTGSTEILSGDILYLIGAIPDLDATFEWLGRAPRTAKNILLVGGGRVGAQVIKGLVQERSETGPKNFFSKIRSLIRNARASTGPSITIIDSDREVCQDLSKKYPEILVRQGDVAEDPILEEEDLRKYDLLLAVTNNQELNLVTALYGKSLGVSRTLALVRKNSYLNIASHLAIDSTISLNSAIVNSVLKLVRQGNLRSIHSLSEGKVEFLEYVCVSGDLFDGHRIQEIRLPRNTLILFITRGGENLLPTGNVDLQMGDSLMLITTGESLKSLEKVLGIN
ncbi:MAG: Trk system potassium transport protein TrkA [Spirochaetales bacterium]|nr:Trk system potassium transport protein TrkA [Spirochaetales bacterium]